MNTHDDAKVSPLTAIYALSITFVLSFFCGLAFGLLTS